MPKVKITTNSEEIQKILDESQNLLAQVDDSPEARERRANEYRQAEKEAAMSRMMKFIDAEFKTSVENGNEAEVRALISQTAISEIENQQAKREDQDLINKRAEAFYAGEQYRDRTKINKARSAYCYYMLDSRGKV